jgi:hypothetical protein
MFGAFSEGVFAQLLMQKSNYRAAGHKSEGMEVVRKLLPKRPQTTTIKLKKKQIKINNFIKNSIG